MNAPRYDVDTIPNDSRGLNKISLLHDNVYGAGVYCHSCDDYNEFEFTDDKNIVRKSGEKFDVEPSEIILFVISVVKSQRIMDRFLTKFVQSIVYQYQKPNYNANVEMLIRKM